MIAIVCLDDNHGMLFNKRRQSQDKVVTKKILKLTNNSPLWMNSYSYGLFNNLPLSKINISDDFLSKAANDEFCFIENCQIKPFEKWIEKIIIFKWNRSYPTDYYFDIDLATWELSDSEEFIGNSHELITMEVYKR